ncbi:uncharacterized protein LOC111612570 [Centruroides sculpturatus]|uniref:uncharacterized protein LOC111612570 n=1 Tax=Centruroides sculpturatus TaxID=218467 RepID=UPI000C6EF483|nr:uncharacterized protein LOC111612570 [Centruroides sculpturatus]
MKGCAYFLVCCVIITLVVGESSKDEASCKKSGGFCTLRSECAHSDSSCINQEGSDSVCCFRSALDDCSAVGGECLTGEECGNAPRNTLAQCPDHQVCCILTSLSSE